MDAQNPQGGTGPRRTWREAARRLRQAMVRGAQRVRGLPPRSRRALAIATAAGVFLASYTVFSQLSPRLREWSRGWRGRPAPLVEVVPETPATPEPVAGGEERAEEDVPATTPAPAAARPVAGQLRWPVAGRVIRDFGWGYDETMADYRFHPGLDIAVRPGEEVRAVYDGMVTRVARDGRLGWVVEITHAPGVISRYGGCRRVRVERGQSVRAGQVIAEAGGPALVESAQPPHLHLEIIWDHRPVDPLTVLRPPS